MKRSSLSPILGGVVLAAIIAVVAIVYTQKRYVPTQSNQIDLQDFVSESEDRIYRNTTHWFGFQFPDGWTVEETGEQVSVLPPATQNAAPFTVTVTDLSADEYKLTLEAANANARVFNEIQDIPGYERAQQFQVTSATGADDTVLFLTHKGINLAVTYHAFSEAHQEIYQSFQLLN